MKHDHERYDQDGLWLRFFEIAWRSRMEGRNVLPGREKIWADEAAALADAAVGVALNLLRKPEPATVYPWHLAPDWATGAVTSENGCVVWVDARPSWRWETNQFIPRGQSREDASIQGLVGYRSDSWRPRPVQETEEAEPEPAIVYPWHEAPSWAEGAVRNRDGYLVWVEEEPGWDYDGGDFIWPEKWEVSYADRNPTEEWPNSWHPIPVQKYDITPGVRPLPNYWRFAPTHKAEEPKAEEAKPIYPWHLAPPRATHAAMDATGFAYWYRGEPSRDPATWEGKMISRVPAFNFSPGDWKDSLEARP